MLLQAAEHRRRAHDTPSRTHEWTAQVPAEERTAFQRAATLLAELPDVGVASWGEQSGSVGRFELVLSNYSPRHATDAQELLRLLELKGDPYPAWGLV